MRKSSCPSLLLIALCVPAGALSFAAEISAPWKVGPDARYLVDAGGKPVLVAGDSAWSLIVQLDGADLDRYLDDRAKKGFNALIVSLLEHKFCTHPPNTKAGLAPFKTPGDFSTPNPAYFDHAHAVVEKCRARGLSVWLAPAYLGYNGADEGWFQELKKSRKETVREYGRFVGERFKDLPNIVWMLGGDYAPTEADRWTVTELAAGILDKDTAHLMTAHGAPRSTGLASFGAQAWLAIDTVYDNRETELFKPLLAARRNTPPRPFVLIETCYEYEHDSKPEQIRRQAYWTLLAGGAGQFFGNNPIWHFDGPGLFPTPVTWQAALDDKGSNDIARMTAAFRQIPWHQLAPDESLLTSGAGSGAGTALAARTADKKLAVVYIASTDRGPREIELSFDAFPNAVAAQWFNPTDASYKTAAGSPFANKGTQKLLAPGDNGTGTNDWLLILKSEPK